METPAETKKTPALSNKVVIIAATAVIAALAIVAFLLLSGRRDGNATGIGYATEAKVMLDQDSLQAAFDEALRNAQDGNIGLKYQNDAFSSNGTDFECYIVNSELLFTVQEKRGYGRGRKDSLQINEQERTSR